MDFDEILPFANEMPPTYLITSSGDTLAKKQTIKLYELLKKNGVSCELANYGKEYGETLPHVFSVLQPFEPAGKDAIDKALAASEGMRQSPRGLRLQLPTFGPSGRQLRLNC